MTQDKPPEYTKRYDELDREIRSLDSKIVQLYERMEAEEETYQKLIALNIMCKDATISLNYPTTRLEKLDTTLINMGNELETVKSRKYELEKEFEDIEQKVETEGWYKQHSISSPGEWKKSQNR